MSRRLDVINLGDPTQKPEPRMMSSCETGGCGGGPEPLLPPPPTFGEVRINGVEIPPEAIAQEIQHHPAPDAETAWVEAARALAVRELLLQEARRLGVVAEPSSDEEGRSEVGDDATIRALLEEEVVPAEPGDSECLRYYQANENRFRTPELFEAAHILIEPEGDTEQAWETALDRARRIVEQVGDSADAFAASARANSSVRSAAESSCLKCRQVSKHWPKAAQHETRSARGSAGISFAFIAGSKAAPSRSTSYATGSRTCLKPAAGRSKRRATWPLSPPGTRSRAC